MTAGDRVPPTLILMSGSTLWGLTWIWLKYAHALGIGPILLTVIAYAAQWLIVRPAVRAPGKLARPPDALGVRHHDGEASVLRGETGLASG